MAISMALRHFDLLPPCVVDSQDHWLQFEPLDDIVWHALPKRGIKVLRWSLAVIEKLRKKGEWSNGRITIQTLTTPT